MYYIISFISAGVGNCPVKQSRYSELKKEYTLNRRILTSINIISCHFKVFKSFTPFQMTIGKAVFGRSSLLGAEVLYVDFSSACDCAVKDLFTVVLLLLLWKAEWIYSFSTYLILFIDVNSPRASKSDGACYRYHSKWLWWRSEGKGGHHWTSVLCNVSVPDRMRQLLAPRRVIGLVGGRRSLLEKSPGLVLTSSTAQRPGTAAH